MNLYILESTDGKTIKIGKANDVEKRLNGLPYSFNKDRSFYYEIGNDVFRVESGLHSMLRNYRVELEKTDGYTEFFKVEVKEKIEDFLKFSGFSKQSLSGFEFTVIDKTNEASKKIAVTMKTFRVNEMSMTQTECAEYLNIPLSTYCLLERTGQGSLSNFLKFLEASGNLDQLISLITPKINKNSRVRH